MPDLERQLNPLDIVDQWIPQAFLLFLAAIGFNPWPYQVLIFSNLFEAWFTRRDLTVKQCRQSGKSVPTALFLAYMICVERLQVVILSTKTSKTRKIARYIIRIMRSAGERMTADGIGEARFEDEAGYVCFSGQPDSNRESDTAHIVLVDESQDIPFRPVHADISPMRAGTNGIFVCLGIGGVMESMGETMARNPRHLHLVIPWQQVVGDRPAYQNTVDKDREEMLPWEFMAHYECQTILDNSALLIPQIHSWDDYFPGLPFDPEQADAGALQAGMDFGRKFDSSVTIACAHIPNPAATKKDDPGFYVLYGFDMYQGVNWTTQLKGMVQWFREIPLDMIRPETNNMGDVLEQLLYDMLSDQEPPLVNPQSYAPVFFGNSEDEINAIRQIALASFAGRLFYVKRREWDPKGCADRILNDLKSVTVKHNIKGKMETSHSDPLAALRVLFCPLQEGHIYERAA